MELPYELEELVLGYLVGDVSTLKNCFLTCRRFASIAQRCLFARVEFIFTEYEINNRPERSFINSSPHTAKLVRSVSIVNSLPPTHFIGDTNLPECLSMLTNLQNFSLENPGFPLLWAFTSFRMQRTLETIFRSVTNISLYGIVDIPLSVLAGCVTLENLSLVLITFITGDALKNPTPPLPNEDRTRLKSLQLELLDFALRRVVNWFMNAACPLDISGLLKLSVTTIAKHYDHRNVSRLLNASAKSLEIFCFSPTLTDGDDPLALNAIDLCHFPRLRILRLRIGMDVARLARPLLQYPRFHLWVHSVVSQLRNSVTIQEISIKSSLPMEVGTGLTNFSMLGWMPVDEILTTIPSLRRVSFFVFFDEFNLSPPVLQKFDEGFPTLTSHGILRVEAADTPAGFFGTKDNYFLQEVR